MSVMYVCMQCMFVRNAMRVCLACVHVCMQCVYVCV